MENAGREMPRYRGHKEVWALKIKEVRRLYPKLGDSSDVLITPEEDGYAPMVASSEYANKHNPQPGMYFVVYDDGYQSCSPSKAFEEGYTRI